MNRYLSRYFAMMALPTTAYFASVLLATWLIRGVEPGALRTALALLPVPAILWMAHTELRRLRRRDELRQRIELEAMTIAFSLSFCAIATLALLDLFGVFDVRLPFATVVMAACWTGAQWWVRARYRYGWLPPDTGDDA